MRTTVSLNAIVEQWLSECDIRDSSKSDYRKKIHLWFRWLSGNSRDPRTPYRKDVVAYKEWLAGNRSLFTANSYVTVVKLFYRWCDRMHYWSDIGQGIKSSTTQRYYNKYPLTLEQSHQLMASVDTSTVIGKRDILMLSLMLFNGLRTCEVNRIDIRDFSSIDGVDVLYVQRKGRTDKQEYVVLHPSTREMLEDYLSERRDADTGQPLMISHAGADRFGVYRLSRRHIARIVKKRLRSIGIDDRRISAHSLRHTFGCLLVEQGVELEQIKEMMGHHNPEVTKIYVEMSRRRKILHHSPTLLLGDRILGRNGSVIR